MKTYHLNRDSLGDCTPEEAEQYARALTLALPDDHDVEWGAESRCTCDDYRTCHEIAQSVFEAGAWWTR